ncbi:MAG: Toxin-antitoxin system, toxin component, RelE family [Candidatus Collierbacteria bacterium GW2011_GWC2_44_18]|uniref:Toxin-antitoxin system, toxin component, RelE family n=1 Tax=Candidatus Collierbacteria bacterium GW2011_GWC2_44_18 TaxID=1618392 RepID=A0A0G1K0T5_9BACT|nr:MAG: Toxin-antitoxin system, toxin component, RelE family [Microgenomates group bacterium GW2011_GWC1_44_10]KKT49752.1 MAG: Toxin-antitoxin system, toxin component, RelE family [Candidatus Collierbacteria bacterium GW2011_GWC2_44_18]
MKLEIDIRVLEFLKEIPQKDSSKAFRYIELFEKYQFSLDNRYLKKVSGPVWELRPGRVRLYLLVKSPRQIIIYAIIKKSQKIAKSDLKTIQSRLSEYL